jgi:phospho-N-acetylmuramoyl-pentapeptide-transferase
MSLAVATLTSWVMVSLWIALMRQVRLGQRVRAEMSQAHLAKTGTPTMGGVGFLTAAAAVYFVMGGDQWAGLWLLGLGFALLGFVDDLGNSLRRPLKAREKLALQALMGLVFAIWAARNLSQPYLGYFPDVLLITLVIVGAANAFNFTDGIDGLLGTLSVVMLLPFYSLLFTQTLLGALLGFLWHNSPKARVFMGDTGSQALGVLIAGMLILDGKLWYLPLVAIIPVVEMLSVIVQVSYFRRTGKRLLRMAPIHHHFELSGWTESKVVFRFAVITALTTALAVSLWGGPA